MVITISATLSPEEVQILANLKGYAEMIQESIGVEIQNPQSREDFVRDVYEKMIKTDAKNVFLSYMKLQRQEQERIEEEAIVSTIDGAITSKVE